MPPSTASHPDSSTSASSIGRLESRIESRRERAALDQLVAGRDHTDARPRMTAHVVHVEACEDTEMCGREQRPTREHEIAGVARRRRPTARARPTSQPRRTTWSPSTRVRSTMTTASAPSGMGAPVMIRIASPGPTATVGARPAGRSPTTRNDAGRVGRAHGVPVHSRVGEGRNRFARDDVLREHEPASVGERERTCAGGRKPRRGSSTALRRAGSRH